MRSLPRSGALVVIAMFVVGGAGLLGFFCAPRGKLTTLQQEWGVPERRLRFVSYNIYAGRRGLEGVIDEINALQPDFALLQEVEGTDLQRIAEAIGMRKYFDHRAFQQGDPKVSSGICIFSKHPLLEVTPLISRSGTVLGSSVVSAVDGKKFAVAAVHLIATRSANPIHIRETTLARADQIVDLVKAWQARGSPPIVIGGDFNQIPMGANYDTMTTHWTDALAQLGRTEPTYRGDLLQTRVDYLCVSRQWSVRAGDVVQSNASDHAPIWIETTGAGPTTTTAPSSAASRE